MQNKVEMNNMFAYSPKKKNANAIPLCSVMKPATNSDSASGKSNGLRLVSATADIINSKAIGANGNMKGTFCAFNISNKLILPTVIITVNNSKLKLTE